MAKKKTGKGKGGKRAAKPRATRSKQRARPEWPDSGRARSSLPAGRGHWNGFVRQRF